LASRNVYDQYARLLRLHYEAVAEVSRARFIVDSSKMTSDALLASSLQDIDLSVLHLVRDPRGVAWSWQRAVRQSGPNGRPFAQRGVMASAARWDVHNSFAELLLKRRLGDRYRQLRYEDFVAEPAAVLDSLANWLGTASEKGAITGCPPRLTLRQARHSVWGNPLRSSSGSIVIARDDAWQSHLSPSNQAVTVAATLPLLLRYGYHVRGLPSPCRDPEFARAHH
jgi:hypothetical protein